MGRAAASTHVPGRVSDAEALWYDPVRWASWVDGFGHVVEVGEGWPAAGARVVWDAPPGGRGRVIERVVAYEPRTGQELTVEDERLRGRRRVSFTPAEEGVTVGLELEYELKQRHALTWAVDVFSVRPAVAASLRRTVARFARERAADLEWDAEASR
jgi:hypothetical protein